MFIPWRVQLSETAEQIREGAVDLHVKKLLHPRSLTARPVKMDG